MGFGTLFFGCLLLFNVLPYYQITDVIMATIILYALYRLNRFNKPLRVAYFASYAFFAYSLFELVLGMRSLFNPLIEQGEFSSHIAIGRALLLACMILPTLLGIRALAKEVDARDLYGRATLATVIFSLGSLLTVLTSIPAFLSLFGTQGQGALYGITLAVLLAQALFTVLTVWRAYATICMPSENKPRVTKPTESKVKKK